jgi:hypothetical protein
MIITIKSDLPKLSKALQAQEGRILRAIAQGLNEGGDKVRTQVRRAMREQTGLIRLNSVTKRERNIRAFATGLAPKSGIGPSRGANLSYVIIYSGKPPTKPNEFKTSVTTGPGGGVTVYMWNVAHKFKRSFRQKDKGGLRMRLGGPRLPIRSFDGPNLAKEAVKDQVAETFLSKSAEIVPPIIDKRLARAL